MKETYSPVSDAPTPPPGWYPDPSGSPAWRAWNGAVWTDLTRPFQLPAQRRTLRSEERLEMGHTIAHVRTYGLPFSAFGAALLLNVANSWTTPQSIGHQRVLTVLVAVGVVTFTFGHLTVNRAIRQLAPTTTAWLQRWPLINLGVWDEIVWLTVAPGTGTGRGGQFRRLVRSGVGALILFAPWHGWWWVGLKTLFGGGLWISASLATDRLARFVAQRTPPSEAAVG